MKRWTQWITGVGGICVLIVLMVFVLTRYAHQEPLTPDPMRPGLQAAVAGAKKGDRGGLDSIIDQINRRNLKVSEALLPDFASFLRDSDPEVQLLGVTGMSVLSSPKSTKPLMKYLYSVDTSIFRPGPEAHGAAVTEMQAKRFLWTWQAVAKAAGTLGKIGDPSAIPAIERVKDCPPFENSDPVTDALSRLGAVKSLSKIGDGATVTDIARESSGVRAIRDPKKVPELIRMVRDSSIRMTTRMSAVQALCEIRSSGATAFVVGAATDSSYPSNVRCIAALSLGSTHDPSVEKPLLELAKDPNAPIRAHALTGLVLYNPEQYFSRWFDTIMDVDEDRRLRAELPDLMSSLPRELLLGQRDRLYRCLQATDTGGRPHDWIRVRVWEFIHSTFREEPRVVLSGASSSYVSHIKGILTTELARTAYQSSYQERQKMAEERLKEIVGFALEIPPNGPRIRNSGR